MPAIWRSLAATSSRRCRQIVPVSRYVVPELLLWRQQRDDVAAGNGVSRQRRDDVAVQPGWLPSREPGSRNLRIIATRAPITPPSGRRWACGPLGQRPYGRHLAFCTPYAPAGTSVFAPE